VLRAVFASESVSPCRLQAGGKLGTARAFYQEDGDRLGQMVWTKSNKVLASVGGFIVLALAGLLKDAWFYKSLYVYFLSGSYSVGMSITRSDNARPPGNFNYADYVGCGKPAEDPRGKHIAEISVQGVPPDLTHIEYREGFGHLPRSTTANITLYFPNQLHADKEKPGIYPGPGQIRFGLHGTEIVFTDDGSCLTNHFASVK
jgi:hypothetical protein